ARQPHGSNARPSDGDRRLVPRPRLSRGRRLPPLRAQRQRRDSGQIPPQSRPPRQASLLAPRLHQPKRARSLRAPPGASRARLPPSPARTRSCPSQENRDRKGAAFTGTAASPGRAATGNWLCFAKTEATHPHQPNQQLSPTVGNMHTIKSMSRALAAYRTGCRKLIYAQFEPVLVANRRSPFKAHRRAALVCLCLILFAAVAPAQDADLLLYHGKIVTVDPQF